jgi:PadR family transcriptional regulator, regulatory protein AphA
MKLRPSSYLMLGMVRLGATSGYAIKKAADTSTRVFWPTSLAQVYPELARLRDAGLLERREDPQGGRSRSAYELTEQGEAALLAWLSSSREVPTQVRDEGLLRLFFADALPPEGQIALLARMSEIARSAAEEITEQVLPLAQAVEQGGNGFPAAVARFGADMYSYSARWLDSFRAELERERRDREGA